MAKLRKKNNVLLAMNYPDDTGLMLRRVHESYSLMSDMLFPEGAQCFIAYPKVNIEHIDPTLKKVELNMHDFDDGNREKIADFININNIGVIIYIDKGFLWRKIQFFKSQQVKTIEYSRYGLDFDAHDNKISRILKRIVHRLNRYSFDHYIAINESEYNAFPSLLGIEKKKLHLIKNGINTDINIESSEVPASLKQTSSGDVVLSVFQMRPHKNIEFIIEVAKEVIKARPNTYFCHVGDGQQFQLAKQLITKFDIADKFILAGHQDDVFAFYQKSSLLIHARKDECFGNVYLEAMLCGLPIISYASQGAIDLVTLTNGILIEKFDAKHFAKEVIKLLNDKDFKEVARVENPMHVKKNFSYQRQASELANLILKITK